MDYPPLTPEELEQLRYIRNHQTGFANLLGIETDYIIHGGARVSMSTDNSQLKNPSGTTTHGGVIYTLADIAAGCATWSTGFHSATAGADFHYVAPALDAKKLIATATALQFGKRLYVYDVRVCDENDRLIAQGTFTYLTFKHRILDTH